MKRGVKFKRYEGVPTKFLGIPLRFDRRIRCLAEARGVLWRRYIAVGADFLTLPKREQQAILLH